MSLNKTILGCENDSQVTNQQIITDIAESLQVNSEENEPIITSLSNTATLPDCIFADLPDLLKRACLAFPEKRERDVFFTGALGVLSGCLGSFTGTYGKDNYYANLFAFVIAPPANGKGSLKFSKQLGAKLHDKYRAESGATLKVLFIPGNCSSSAMIKVLKDSGQKGIIFETEADTLSGSLKKEWGDFSDMLRKGFHHEGISIARITNSQLDEMTKPRLSIVLSGTPSQLGALIPSADDGLFSRFLFYAFQSALVWKDMRPNEDINFEAFFDELADVVVDIENFHNSHPATFKFSNDQWDKHNTIFSVYMRELTQFVSEDVAGTVKRLGIILFRIAMVLTALRKAEVESTESVVMCSDVDFDIAAKLIHEYLQHAKFIFNNLPKKSIIDPMKKQFYNSLPSMEFARSIAGEIAERLGMSVRCATNYLREFVDCGLLFYPRYGFYTKNAPAISNG